MPKGLRMTPEDFEAAQRRNRQARSQLDELFRPQESAQEAPAGPRPGETLSAPPATQQTAVSPSGKPVPVKRRRYVRSESPPAVKEADVLAGVLRALRIHPAVGWIARMNSGQFQPREGTFVRCGWKGAPDLIGQMRDGRFLGVECKSPTGRVKPDQQATLDRIVQHGGVAFVARSVPEAIRLIEQAKRPL